MARKPLSHKTTAWLLLLAGLAGTALGISSYFETEKFMKTAVETQGTIIDFTQKTDLDADQYNRTTYYPKVEYTASDGRKFSKTSTSGTTQTVSIGTSMKVWYDPADPENAILNDGAGGAQNRTWWVLGFGALGIIGSIVYFVISARQKTA